MIMVEVFKAFRNLYLLVRDELELITDLMELRLMVSFMFVLV
jgi:hypothetical protein